VGVGVRHLSEMMIARPGHPAPPLAAPVMVAGFLGSALGLGEAARMHLAALRRAGIETVAVDLSGEVARCDFPVADAVDPARIPDGGTLILHVNAPETLWALSRFGRGGCHGRKVVGYWFWELPVLPHAWRWPAHWLHEIWTATDFCAESIRAAIDLPVRVVPLAPPPEPDGPGRAAFGIADDAFVCLAAFDMHSSLGRKNPMGAVRAFKAAFGDDPGALLLLKGNHVDPDSPAWRTLLAETEGLGTIRLIDTVFTRTGMHHLIQCVDVVLSLHRAEGLGLLMAEGMTYGKLAIATGWSGNMQFMTTDNSLPVAFDLVPVADPDGIYHLPGTHWAEPSVEDAAAKLRMARGDADLRRRLGSRAAETMRQLSRPVLPD
jgi:hypothetical protein